MIDSCHHHTSRLTWLPGSCTVMSLLASPSNTCPCVFRRTFLAFNTLSWSAASFNSCLSFSVFSSLLGSNWWHGMNFFWKDTSKIVAKPIPSTLTERQSRQLDNWILFHSFLKIKKNANSI